MSLEVLSICYRVDDLWQSLANSARILGTANAKIRISRFTFIIRVGKYQFVVTVGVKLWRKT